jgi:hypothetical protein
MLIQNEHGEWEFDWPVRGEQPEEERDLRKQFLAMFTTPTPITGRAFTYPSRIRKEDTDGS